METVEVKFELYGELLKKLEDFYPDSQKISGELRCAMEGKWKNIHGYVCVVDSWPNFTTVIWKPDRTENRLEFLKYHHAVVTKDKEQLKIMLRTPGIIDWKSCCRFAAINESLHDVIQQVSEENGRTFTVLEGGNIWSVTSETLKTISVPDGFSLKALAKDDAITVAKDWVFSAEGVVEYVTALLENFSSIALYNQGQQLVGFMLETNYGSIGLLRVLKEYRGQGYSKVIVSGLAQTLLQNGRQVHSYIDPTNPVSCSLHQNLGFMRHHGMFSWLRHDPNNIVYSQCRNLKVPHLYRLDRRLISPS